MSGVDSAPALTLLLPPRSRLAGDIAACPKLATLLSRADRSDGDDGEQAQLLRHFDVLPRGLPVAALTREIDCGDAAHGQWLRADPAHVRADLGAGRLLACGDLDLTRDEADALVRALKPLFGDEGSPISVGDATRWYLMLPREVELPVFAPPEQVLGDDIFAHLPQGDLGRRWRRLISEAQVVLHNHPVNAQRAQAGKATVNSLWFWGGGGLPDRVLAQAKFIVSDDFLLRALAARATTPTHATAQMTSELLVAGALIDVRSLRRLGDLETRWIAPLLDAVGARRFERVQLDFADGAQWHYRRGHRWRLWRRPATTFA